jgi:hypothetical protein
MHGGMGKEEKKSVVGTGNWELKRLGQTHACFILSILQFVVLVLELVFEVELVLVFVGITVLACLLAMSDGNIAGAVHPFPSLLLFFDGGNGAGAGWNTSSWNVVVDAVVV